MKSFRVLSLITIVQAASAFAPVTTITRFESSGVSSCQNIASSSALSMANDDELMRFSRASRSAGVDDRVVELKRPLGLVLNEDDNGNVYVERIAPRGNAARTGIVSLKLV